MAEKTDGPFSRFIKAATSVEPNEIRATVLSFAFLFMLMFAYNVLKPIRDAMASDWSDPEVATLWTINFFISLIAVSLYGFFAARVRFSYLVPGIYSFFAASFVAFYLGSAFTSDVVYIEKSFYVWISVFSLFHISVFWSLMADVFSKGQAPRLFALIASGASIGTLFGSSIPLFLATIVGAQNLMLLAAAILVATLPTLAYLQRLKVTELGNQNVGADLNERQSIGGNPFAGFTLFLKNPYLLGIGAFILLYTSVGSFVYFELKNLLEVFSRDERTSIWAGINTSINVIAIATAWFATGRITTRLGLAKTLALIPFLVAIGLMLVAVNPVVAAIIAAQILLKGGNYSITRPGREMLFTVVDRETRFKAKPVIDIVVYRGGDTLTGWAFAGLTAGLGLGMGAVAAIGAGIALLWAALGLYLGRVFDRTDAQPDKETGIARARQST
jgi:AAA family ATP:ADP antiporter